MKFAVIGLQMTVVTVYVVIMKNLGSVVIGLTSIPTIRLARYVIEPLVLILQTRNMGINLSFVRIAGRLWGTNL
jgi:hypothetical protein